MSANNQGIDHIRRPGFARGVLCGNDRAHQAVTFAQFREARPAHVCKRCEARLAKMDAIKTRRSAT